MLYCSNDATWDVFIIHHVQKNRTDSILALTLTNLDNFSHILALIILTIGVTQKL